MKIPNLYKAPQIFLGYKFENKLLHVINAARHSKANKHLSFL